MTVMIHCQRLSVRTEQLSQQFELWTIRTFANSALVNSNPKKFSPSRFGPRPRVNSDPDHWSIRTSKREIL